MDTSSVVSMETIKSTKSFGQDDMPSCPRCWFQLLTIVTMIKAVIARLIFGVHSFVAIWRVTDVKGPAYWCLTLALMLLMVEGVLTIWKKKGAEWKWFSPVVFFYLCSVVPAIWFLELDILEKRLHNKNLVEGGKLPALNLSRSAQSQTSSEGLSIKGVGIYIPIELKAEDWTKVLEQLLLLFLIVGRWLLPKGDITRDQLSQLLLVNIGMAADIIELFEAFREEQVKHNWILTVIILSLWTGSLLQFTLVVTATKARKPRVAISSRKSDLGTCFCCETEIWAILTSIAMQDGPFLVLRLLLILRYEVVSYMNVFFTCKNTLVMLLQIYRIAVVLMERGQHKRDKEKEDREDTEIMTLSRSESNLKSRTARSHPALRKSKSFAGLQKTNSINEMSNNTKPARSYPAIPNRSDSRPSFIEYADELCPRPLLRPRYPKELQLLPARNEPSDMDTPDSDSRDISHHGSPGRNSLHKETLHESPIRNFILNKLKKDSFHDSDRKNSIGDEVKRNSLQDHIEMCENDTLPLATNEELSVISTVDMSI